MSNPDLVITPTQYKIEVLGTVYEVTKPSYKMSKELNKEANEAGEAEALDVTIKYLIKLGLPESLFESDDISVADILEISRLVFGVKKK